MNFFLTEQGLKWFHKKHEFMSFVAEHRLGKTGLRPWGSKRPAYKNLSLSQGARIREKPTEATKQNPLAGVFHKIKVWFEKEREHGVEVRARHIRERTKYELEYEQDRQQVLQQQGSKKYNADVLAQCQKKLEFVNIHDGPNRKDRDKQDNFFDRRVYPFIGAHPRAGQNKSQQDPKLDRTRFLLTTQGVDYMIYLVCQGSWDDLSLLVAEPDVFIKHRETTAIVVIDETALWLKLRGEEKVLISFKEVYEADKRRRLRRAIKRDQEKEAAQAVEAMIEEYLAGAGDDETRDMISQFYQAGGDKHRLTLVNISAVHHWFQPELKPVCDKSFHVLVVFCEHEIHLEWIDDEHRFNRDVKVCLPDGNDRMFNKGDFTRFLWSYVEMRKNAANKEIFKSLLIWGQKKAWVNTQICVDLAHEIADRHGQAIQIFDCLGARWSEHSILAHYERNQLMTPLAPGCRGKGGSLELT